jgi:hypothetical protein
MPSTHWGGGQGQKPRKAQVCRSSEERIPDNDDLLPLEARLFGYATNSNAKGRLGYCPKAGSVGQLEKAGVGSTPTLKSTLPKGWWVLCGRI